MPRLGSKKSRTGCKHCKARRVKCDELRPCTNCKKYGAECSLLSDTLPSLISQSGVDAKDSPSTQSPALRTPDTQPSPPVGPSQVPSYVLPSQGDKSSWMKDLELMHHYTAHAFLTMPGVEQAKQTWGYSVPQEAFRFDFLMHSILAFSALHLAHINPSACKQYQVHASTHQSAALAGLNRVLQDVNAHNCHAIFAAGSLVIMNAFADATAHNLDSLIEIFQLLKGMSAILNSNESLIHSGPFAQIVRLATDTTKPPPLLSSLLVDLQASAVEATNPVIAQATALLRDALFFGIEQSVHPPLRAAMFWPIGLSIEYLDLLRSNEDPSARRLMEFYLRMLAYAGTQWWFLSGWRDFQWEA